MYDAVEEYFATAPSVNMQSKVRNTMRPPIYLQHQGKPLIVFSFLSLINTISRLRNGKINTHKLPNHFF